MHPSAAPTSPLRILVVDADRRVRDSLRELICCEVGLETVAAVGTADEAREAVHAAEPDVIVIDPRLPEIETGMQLIDEFRIELPATRLLVMSWSEETDVVGHSAHGLLDKSASPEDLVAAIAETVRTGGRA